MTELTLAAEEAVAAVYAYSNVHGLWKAEQTSDVILDEMKGN